MTCPVCYADSGYCQHTFASPRVSFGTAVIDGQRQPKATPSAPVSFLNISIAVPIGIETIEVDMALSDLSDHDASPPSSARALKDGA